MNALKLCDISVKNPEKTDNLLPSGVWPVVLTPFRHDLTIDWNGYQELLEWYTSHQCAGLFAVCLSSELYCLNREEMIELAHRAVAATDLPVLASGYLGRTRQEKLDSVKAIADTGVDAVVIPVCQVVNENDNDAVLLNELERIAECTGNIPLGLYECPVPYHRLLSPEILQRCAETGRFRFLKDTCCDLATITKKIKVCAETPLKVFNANVHNLHQSVIAGGAGFNGLAASFFPELLDKLISYTTNSAEAEELQVIISVGQSVVSNKYPAGAKYFLKQRGVNIEKYCRIECPELKRPDIEILNAFKILVEKWLGKY